MPAMTNKEFAQSAWAIAKIGRPGAAPPPSFVDRLWQQAHLRAPALAPAETGLLLFAVSRLGLHAPPQWLADVLVRLRAALPGLRPDQQVNAVVALARMGRGPGPEWLAAFEAATRLGEFTLQVRAGAAGASQGPVQGVRDLAARAGRQPCGSWLEEG
jgi:hypothetical protein